MWVGTFIKKSLGLAWWNAGIDVDKSILLLAFGWGDSDTNLRSKEGSAVGLLFLTGGVTSIEGLLSGSLLFGTLMWYLKICDEAKGLLALLSNETFSEEIKQTTKSC